MIPDTQARGGHRMELVGELAAILSLSESSGTASSSHGPDMTKPPRFARAASETMVAGACSRRNLPRLSAMV